MDDKWFKHRQKIAGVTADQIADKLGRDRSLVSRIYVGRQQMTMNQAKAFADVLGVPLEQVLEKAGILDATDSQRVQPGFSESDATPWKGKTGGEREAVGNIAQYFGGNRPGIDVWTVNSSAMSLGGYLPGDKILLDTHQAERCGAGDVVIAQVYNWQNGNAKTILRRFEPPVLVSDSADPEDKRVQVVDLNNVVIMGKITAQWRS